MGRHKARHITPVISGEIEWRINNDMYIDTWEDLNNFISYWVNNELAIALDTGELKDEYSNWREAGRNK